MNCTVLKVVALLVVIFGVQHAVARPNNRVKRVSDSHLADLETKIALNNKVKGFAITMPVGAGRIDPLKIGRRRRSQSRFLDVLFNQSEEDNGDPIPRDYNDFLYNYNRDYNYLQSLH
ncbi:uncharacterized protein LOC108906518 [Anoplophora glabripennis]|uniref:uncharacterized protein LOC108906518 n=1 Tax=Anoplophora glabripennis TaxID=217634 RepID=UPI00087395CE|nr:uncharacterized protein LOC108906518 [Anoplophora glabripennis]